MSDIFVERKMSEKEVSFGSQYAAKLYDKGIFSRNGEWHVFQDETPPVCLGRDTRRQENLLERANEIAIIPPYLQGRVKFPTGGTAREFFQSLEKQDAVKFCGRQ